jgi:hypothetical protein
MKIIEQFTQSKTGDDSRNEDCIAVTPDFLAVFDGVTSRAGVTLQGMSTGRFAALALANALAALPSGIAALPAVENLNAALKDRASAAANAEGKSFTDIWAHPAAALLVYSRARREIWRVADSSFLLDGAANYKIFPQEQTVAQLRRAFLCAKIARGASEESLRDHDMSWDVVTPIIAELKIFANYDGPFGYGVLNGSPVPPAHVEVFPAKDAREIVFASDGYPEVFTTLAATETDLARIVAEDPLMYRLHPQVKGVKKGHVSFDDRSYIRFQPE